MTDEPNANDEADPCFEEALDRLETIVHELEEGEIGLAEALARYESGVELLRRCYALLERAERRIEMLCGFDADGSPIIQPFDDTKTFAPEEPAAKKRKRRTKRAPSSADESTPDDDSPPIDTSRSLF